MDMGSRAVPVSGSVSTPSASVPPAPVTLSLPALCGLVLLYAVLGYLGLQFDDGSGLVTAVWFASGLAAAVALTGAARALWVPFLGNALLMPAVVIFDYGGNPALAMAIGIGCAVANTGEAWLIQRLAAGYNPQRHYDSAAFLRFVALAAPIGCMFSALVGIATMVAFAGKAALDPLTRIALWWSGDMVGCVLLAPLLLSWRAPETQPARWPEAFGLLLLVTAYLLLLLLPELLPASYAVLLAPVGLPLLYWATTRLHLFVLTLLLLFIGMGFVLAHYHGVGPFQLGTAVQGHLALQVFLVTLLATTALAATLLRERRSLNERLLQANQQLEDQVRERTEMINRQRARLQTIISVLPLQLSVRDDQGELLLGNRALARLADQEPSWLREAREQVQSSGRAVRDLFGQLRDHSGDTLQIQAQIVPLLDESEQSVLVVAQDVTERVRRQRVEQLHMEVLQRLADDAALSSVLQQIISTVEQLEPDVLATILLVDTQRGVVRHAAAGRMPPFFCEAIDGLPYGPGVGSCGHTAATGLRTIVSNIAEHPFWQPYRDLAQRAGVAACWSEPVRAGDGTVLATFALYARNAAEPTPGQLRLIEAVAALVRLTIERHRSLQHVRLLSRAMEQTASAVVLCDAEGLIEFVNASFLRMLLIRSEQALGHSAFDLLLTDDEEGQLVRAAMLQVVTAGTGWHGEFVGRRHNQNTLWLHASISPMLSGRGDTEKLVMVLEDISSYKQAQAKAEYLAFHDALTGLANRRLFLLRLDEAVRRVRRAGTLSALLFFDLDEFKRINDTLGHETGDELLRQVAQRLLASVREDDLVARLGGDEFCLLLGNLHDSVEAGTLARKLMAVMAAPLQLGEHTLVVSCSVGITLLPIDGDRADELLRNADLAMYRAKAEGKNRFVFFAPEMNAVSRERLQLESELRRALGKNQFVLHLQPIVNLADGVLRGYEVLVRWQHPQRGLLSPDTFIPIAEHTGLIVPMGEEILRQALQLLPALNTQAAGLRLSVNVSARQLREPDFGVAVAALLQQHDVPFEQLQLEITESLLLERSAITENNLETLVAAGARIVIDDFGTGYTSFSQLRELPIHGIKLDRMFIRELPGNDDDAAIVAALIAMAKQLHLNVVAEGVETDAQRDFLLAQGCELGQGWLFGKPAPLSG